MSEPLSLDPRQLEQIVLRHLPELVEKNPVIKNLVFDLAEHKKQTSDWFHEMLDELRRDREEQTRKWEEQNCKWDEQNRKLDEQNRKWDEKWEEQNRRWDKKWEEQNRKWEEQNRKWEEQNRKWDEQNRKWDEQNRKWDEQNRKWDEQNRKWNEKWEEQNRRWDEQSEKWENQDRKWQKVHEEIMEMARKHDRGIGALGARWGMQAESTFRNALAAILEKNFAVQVLHVNDYDDEGMVFGRPDQIELDVIIKNGLLIICEIKSSISQSDMYTFERKVRFYEKTHQRRATRMMVISPMVDFRAKPVAEKLGIEVYTDSSEVPVEL